MLHCDIHLGRRFSFPTFLTFPGFVFWRGGKHAASDGEDRGDADDRLPKNTLTKPTGGFQYKGKPLLKVTMLNKSKMKIMKATGTS